MGIWAKEPAKRNAFPLADNRISPWEDVVPEGGVFWGIGVRGVGVVGQEEWPCQRGRLFPNGMWGLERGLVGGIGVVIREGEKVG